MSRKALLIGINYTGTSSQLTGCINDIKNVEVVLKRFMYNCVLLTDETVLKPTKINIIESLKTLIKDCKSGDTLFFYYSGHGSQIKDTGGDEVDKLDEVLVPLDYLNVGVISDDELFNIIKLKNGVKFYGFTDCCHSGTICDLKYNVVSGCKLIKGVITNGMKYNPVDWTSTFIMSKLIKEKSDGMLFFISGCKDNQVSLETQGQGAFTYCFLKFFNENAFVNNRFTFKDLLKFLHCNLQINRFVQIPQMSSNLITIDLFFNI